MVIVTAMETFPCSSSILFFYLSMQNGYDDECDEYTIVIQDIIGGC
jgi:hypothetical protein